LDVIIIMSVKQHAMFSM